MASDRAPRGLPLVSMKEGARNRDVAFVYHRMPVVLDGRDAEGRG
jgi:hypothetical protein